MTHFVRKDSRRGDGSYRGIYTLPWDNDSSKRYSIALKTKRKRIAEKRLDEHLERLELEHEGMPVPAGLWGAPKQKIAELADEYEKHLLGVGRKPKHAHDSTRRIRFLSKTLKWVNLEDVKPSPFERWRSSNPKNPRTKQGLGHKTLNEYLVSFNAFFDWVQKMGYSDSNPLRLIDSLKTKGYEKKKRRAWSDKEFSRFMADSPQYRTDYRSAIYLMRWTGLRVKEAETLTWGDVSLESERPFIIIRAHRSKNRKEQALPIFARVANFLHEIQPEEFDSSTSVLGYKIPASQQFRRDLEKLGIQYRTEIGDLDFHSLRHTFGTWLVTSGVDLKEAQILMRHSDIRMTADRYTDVTRIPVARTIRDLDKLHADKTCAPICAPLVQPTTENAGQPRTETGDSGNKKALEDQGLKSATLSNFVQDGQTVNGCSGWDRTSDQVINSHLLYR